MLRLTVETIKEDSDSDAEPQYFNIAPEPTATIEGLTPAQRAAVDQLVHDSVQSAVKSAVTEALAAYGAANPRPAALTSSPSPERSTRAFTADLQLSVDYYLLKINPSVALIKVNKVKYPRLPFTDYSEDVKYDA